MARSTGEKETLFSTTIVKLQSLFQDPEEDTGSRALCKKVRPISELQQQIQQLQSAAHQYKEGRLPPKFQLETKETMISFQNALQVKTSTLLKYTFRTELSHSTVEP